MKPDSPGRQPKLLSPARNLKYPVDPGPIRSWGLNRGMSYTERGPGDCPVIQFVPQKRKRQKKGVG